MWTCGHHIETNPTPSFTTPIIIVQGKPSFKRWIKLVKKSQDSKQQLTITKILLFGDNKLDFETQNFTNV